MAKSSYIAKCTFIYGVNNKRYNVGDRVDLPDDITLELLDKGFIAFTEQKKIVEKVTYEKATIEPEEPYKEYETTAIEPEEKKKRVKK